MLIEYKCFGCGDWHVVNNAPLPALYLLLRVFMRNPPPPFTANQWMMIISTEIARIQRRQA